MYPNFEEEKILWKQGIRYVAGLDEAGRGPLAARQKSLLIKIIHQ